MGFPDLCHYHYCSPISWSNTSIDECISKWVLCCRRFVDVCVISLGRDCHTWQMLWWRWWYVSDFLIQCSRSPWTIIGDRLLRDRGRRSRERGRWLWRWCDSRTQPSCQINLGVKTFLAPLLELCAWQLAEASSTRLKWFHQYWDLGSWLYVTGTAKLLKRPSLKDNVVLLSDSMVEVGVVHTWHRHPSSLTYRHVVRRVVIKKFYLK